MTATPDDASPAPEPDGTPGPVGDHERQVFAPPRPAGAGETPVVRVRPVAARNATTGPGVALPPGVADHGAADEPAPGLAADDGADAAENPEGPLRRDEVYRHDVVSGRERPETALTRFLDRLRELLTSRSAKEEDALDARLAVPRSLDRPHVVAFASSKGGVGKTTCTVLVGSLVAEVTRRPVLAIDTNPDFGSLGRLAPDDRRSDRTMEDLLAAIEEDVTAIAGAAALSPFVSRTPSGLDLLASPRDPEVMARMTPARYGLLLDVLTRFYPVVLLDLGTGVAEALPQFALSRADQAVVVTGSSMVTNATVLDASPTCARATATPRSPRPRSCAT